MEAEPPRSLHGLHQRQPRSIRDRHVKLKHPDDEPSEVQHQQPPLAPPRLSLELRRKYRHWKRDLGVFLIVTCVSLGLTADYALAGMNETPVICYGGSWMKLGKCSNREALSLSKADASGKALVAEGVFEKGLHFVDHLPELARLAEELRMAEESMGVDFVAVLNSATGIGRYCSNKLKNKSMGSTWEEFGHLTSKLEEGLRRTIHKSNLETETLVWHAQSWISGYVDIFQHMLREKVFEIVSFDEYIQSNLQNKPPVGTGVSWLISDASRCLENTDRTLKIVEILKIRYRILAHPARASADTHEPVSHSEANLLMDPKYWWKQLSPFFDDGLRFDTESLASFFARMLKAEKLLKLIKKRNKDLLAALIEFEDELKTGKALSARGKVTRNVLEGWLPRMTSIVASLEKLKLR